MRADDLFNAFEGLDADMVYAAHAESQPKPLKLRRMAIAAALFLILISAAVYFVFVMPVSAIFLDSSESVTVVLNSRGKVLSATNYPELSGRSAEEAVRVVAEDMLSSGALSADENTLILGGDRVTEPMRSDLTKVAEDLFSQSRFRGAIVSLPCTDSGAKAAVIDLLTRLDDSLTSNRLQMLSANALNLLLHESVTDTDAVILSGTPSESAYIGFDKAVAKALSLSAFAENELSDLSVSYSVYHGRLIYLVRLNAGENSEAYLINALTGTTEEALKAPSSRIDQKVSEVIGKPIPSDPTLPPADSPPTQAQVTEPPTDANEPAAPYEDYPTDPPATVPTSLPTTAGSEDFSAVSISLKELSFVVLSPPESAQSIPFRTLFEGQVIEPRGDEKINTGEVAVITDNSQLQAFLKKHSGAYTDKTGKALQADFTAEDFKTQFILASACTVSDASYYTTVTDLRSDGEVNYMENSLSYGVPRTGEYSCRILSLYAVDRSAMRPDSPLSVY